MGTLGYSSAGHAPEPEGGLATISQLSTANWITQLGMRLSLKWPCDYITAEHSQKLQHMVMALILQVKEE
jgi:hypothetical protein